MYAAFPVNAAQMRINGAFRDEQLRCHTLARTAPKRQRQDLGFTLGKLELGSHDTAGILEPIGLLGDAGQRQEVPLGEKEQEREQRGETRARGNGEGDVARRRGDLQNIAERQSSRFAKVERGKTSGEGKCGVHAGQLRHQHEQRNEHGGKA